MDASILIQKISFKPIIAKGFSVGYVGDIAVSELMRQADVAMYEAKNRKSRDALEYDPSIESDAQRNTEILDALQEATSTGQEFQIVYQPICDAKTGEMVLAEALLRWHSKSLGNVPPVRFIPIAERSGIIVKLGKWVIERVYDDLSIHPSLCVSINISPVQLRSNSLLKDISQLANQYSIDPARVTFELTEGMLIEDPEIASFTLDALRDQGYSIAIDDFGTGFSSIGYLRKFKLDKLKIDKSFVDDLGTKENSESLMTALAYLSRALDLEIVAEGVETEQQLELLKSLDYNLLQGYLLSKPMPLEDLVQSPFGTYLEHETPIAVGQSM
jgi:EAL domain-containing protein (putative c-di-GMP-specific phosphodiesterase class I)